MRATSSAVSLTVHVAIGAAVVLGTTNAAPTIPRRPAEISILVQPSRSPSTEVETAPAGRGPTIGPAPAIEVPWIPITLPQSGAPTQPLFPLTGASATAATIGGEHSVWTGVFDERVPEKLAGPLPVYPELLRQAGIQGRVVLEALVDTTGRVDPASVTVVSASNPAFVAAARNALLATLFRPGRVDGRPVRVPVRIPFDFKLRDGAHVR